MAHTTKNNSTEIKHYWSMPFLFFSWFFFFWPNSLATPWEYWVTSCLWQFSSFNKSFLPVYLMSSPFIILPFNVCLFFWLFFFFNPEGKKKTAPHKGQLKNSVYAIWKLYSFPAPQTRYLALDKRFMHHCKFLGNLSTQYQQN